VRTSSWLPALPIASYAWLVATVVIAGALHPGYDHASQFMSELGAGQAPNAWAVNYLGFLPTELLFLAFIGLALGRVGRNGWLRSGLLALGLYAVGLVLAAFFPCDSGCRPEDPTTTHLVHIASGLGAYLFAILGLFPLVVGRFHSKDRGLAVSGLVVGLFALVCFIQLTPDNPLVGLYQRALETGLYLWCIAFAFHLGRRVP